MPFQQVEGSANPLATVLGLAGGYLAGNPARKAAQAKQEYERSEKTKEDARQDAELALNTQAETRQQQQFDSTQQHERLRDGAMANVAKQYPQPTTDPVKDPGTWQRYYFQIGSALRQAGFPEDGAKAEAAAATVGRAVVSDTQANVNTATVPLRGAQTNKANADAANTATLHEDRMKALTDKLAIVQATLTASLTRAQIAASEADRRSSEATARAMMAQQAALQRQIASENSQDRRQERGFEHSDAQLNKRFAHEDKAKKSDNIPKMNTSALETNPKFKALPGSVQSVILSETKKGASLEGIRQDIQSSQMDDAIKQQALEALGAAPAPKPVQGGNWLGDAWRKLTQPAAATPTQAGP